MAKGGFTNPDLHMHSVFSDGTDTPEELLRNVKAAGIDLFSLTDHDCLDGCDAVMRLLQPGDPAFIRGVELSCEDPDGERFHVLGYRYDPDGRSLCEAVELTHGARRARTVNRFLFLEATCGFAFTEQERQSVLSLDNPGRPHFVNLMMEKGYVKTRQEGFDIMARYHGNEPVLSPEAGIRAILASGGIPVLAHGILGDGSKRLTEEQITARVCRLTKAGLQGLECFYSSFTPGQKAIMLELAERYGLVITAGSDYHGRIKSVRPGETNGPEAEKMAAFYRLVR